MTSPDVLAASKSTRTEAEVRAQRAGGFTAWLAAKVGADWVLARNTSRIRHHYGDDVVCLSAARYAARYAALKAEYEHETGLSADGYVLPPGAPRKSFALAAPALLAALKEVAAMPGIRKDRGALWHDSALAAIAQAEGPQT